jgi:peptidyl-prolyl cis-trans isomerase B (cyclophilin B)
MKRIFLSIALVVCTSLHVGAQTTTTEVLLKTTAGDIRIALYDETPQHRDNFLKLTKMGSYDSLLFHRVIKDFMVQSGDIFSKNAKPGQLLGMGDYDYTQEAEFRLPKIFHRRGTVAAAREGDHKNPERRSGASQFYIVWGKTYDDRRLDYIQTKLDSITGGTVQLTPEMREVYKTIGGAPHLDGQYTVFGEVTEGLDIIEKMQLVATDKNDRPLEDIRILKATVTKDLPEPEKPKAAPQKKQVKRPVRRR